MAFFCLDGAPLTDTGMVSVQLAVDQFILEFGRRVVCTPGRFVHAAVQNTSAPPMGSVTAPVASTATSYDAEGPLPCIGWDSWAAVGIPKGTQPTPPGRGYVAGFGLWRDPTVAGTFFGKIRSTGVGRSLVWERPMSATDKSTGRLLAYTFKVDARGVILSMTNTSNAGAPVQPLRQFNRALPFH